ncbi:YhdT family protein [Xenorhabdus sp. Flor]|uniref:YhdT family protein n=1 Tax=Xenorhabdus cabanillasii TaxID=351673 RepID=UPI00199360E2|nr:YhdT family protein [Xenorhabdus sp. Flor]MBD2815408.1 YhdT family protein [Xenorhabdus sp. Flor]
MDRRFVQSHKEARWAVFLTLAYLVGWLLSAYLPGNTTGFTGLPLWFELSCLMLPILFIILCWMMVKFVFKDVPLEDNLVDDNAK